MSKILILGASGLIGKALINELKEDYDIFGTSFSQSLDLCSGKAFKFSVDDFTRIDNILREVEPDIVVSALRGDFDKQLEIHRSVAKYLSEKKGRMIYCSTANVFDNNVESPHYENDQVDPESDYGLFKARCERELAALLGNQVCLARLPLVWGKDSHRLNEFLKKLMNREVIEVYDNLFVTNNTDIMVAKQIRHIIEQKVSGILHLASQDVVNHRDFLADIADRLGFNDPKFIEVSLEKDKYYLAVLSKEDVLPDYLRLNNVEIIDYLTDINS